MITLETKPESIPVPDDADDLEESPEELLRRLELEKQDWKAQLAQMKATLESQDRKIEEDRARLREVLDKEEATANSRVVPVNKAASRIVNVNSGYIQTVQSSAARIPAITEHARTVWPSIQEFHNMRARTVAKGVPYAPSSIPELYLQSYGMGPPRSLNPGYPAAIAAQLNQDFTVDGMGRKVRRAKVLNVVDGGSRILNSSLSPSTTPLRPSLASNMSSTSYLTSGRGSTSAPMPTTISTAQPQQTTTGGWFTSIFGSTPATPVVQSPNVRYRYA